VKPAKVNSVPPILYEDAHCIVIDKPAGLAVQGGRGVANSLDVILRTKYQDARLVHRLDKDTSGCLLVAKNAAAAAFYAQLMGNKSTGGEMTVIKTYEAVAEIAQNARTDMLENGEGVLQSKLDGRRAVTNWKILQRGKSAFCEYAVFELTLVTGITHQIRRQLAAAGFPILGDAQYGNFALNKVLRRSTANGGAGLHRMLLHAKRLAITAAAVHPPYLPLDVASPPQWRRIFPYFTAAETLPDFGRTIISSPL
jgi:23S rRNA pseudouridine955/2504/2580 synthase